LSCFTCSLKDNYLKNKVCIITGANQGIGYQTAKSLVMKGCHVILGCRNKDLGTEAAKKLSRYGKATFLRLDLASFDSVKSFVESFNQLNLQLHILINNAGVMALPKFQLTENKNEMQFQVNHLGHFLLTMLLMPKLKESAPSRIINLSSNAHANGTINFDRLPTYNDGQSYSGWGAYGVSKECNILFTYELQKRLRGTGVSCLAVHPGVVRTGLWQGDNKLASLCLFKLASDGAKPSIYLASSKSFETKPTNISMDKNGKSEENEESNEETPKSNWFEDYYFIPCCCCTKKSRTSEETYVIESQRKLWALSLELCGLKEEDCPKYQNSRDETEPITRKLTPFEYVQFSVSYIPCCFCFF